MPISSVQSSSRAIPTDAYVLEVKAMELLAEILFEVYGELMFLIIPDKRLNKKYVIVTKIIAVLVFIGVLSLAIWGVVLISEYNNLAGIVPISIAAVISLLQIVAGIVLFKKHH